MAKTNQNKNNSSKITNTGLFSFNNSVDIMLKIDFNQGLDARIIAENKSIAELLPYSAGLL